MNSKYVILFHFESNQGGKVALPSSNKGDQEIFRDDKGSNWIQNGLKNHYLLKRERICII